MSIGYRARDQRDEGAWINSVLDDYGLNVFEFRVYARLVRRAGKYDRDNSAYQSVPNMARELGVSERQVRYALRLLDAMRLVEAVERRGETTDYFILPVSKWRDPKELESSREAIKRGDPAKAPHHKPKVTPAHGAAPTTPAHHAPLHTVQPTPAHGAAKGTPFKATVVVVDSETEKNDFLPRNEPTPKPDPYTVARELKGVEHYAWADLSNAGDTDLLDVGLELVTSHRSAFGLIAKLRAEERANGTTFRLWLPDVLTHIRAYGADTVEKALKAVLQTPKGSIRKDRWSFYLSILENPTKPAKRTNADRAASSKHSGRDVKESTKYSDEIGGVDMTELIRQAEQRSRRGEGRR